MEEKKMKKTLEVDEEERVGEELVRTGCEADRRRTVYRTVVVGV